MDYLCGIDYGNKLSGTTVLACYHHESGELYLQSSDKNKDADEFIKRSLELIKPEYVFIDAPLSLPKVYTKPYLEDEKDYFFRKSDKMLNAMSPMFLGGLTARAIRLKDEMYPILFYETYPTAQAKRLKLGNFGYKKEITHVNSVMEVIFQLYTDLKPVSKIKNWHEVDAVLALIAALRFKCGKSETFGEAEEGLIYL